MTTGYSLEAYCHECYRTLVKTDPYVLIEECVDAVGDIMKQHRQKVHGGEPKP